MVINLHVVWEHGRDGAKTEEPEREVPEEDSGGWRKRDVSIDQLFSNDPDGFMIEICNCENLKLVPAGSLGKIKLPLDTHKPPI